MCPKLVVNLPETEATGPLNLPSYTKAGLVRSFAQVAKMFHRSDGDTAAR